MAIQDSAHASLPSSLSTSLTFNGINSDHNRYANKSMSQNLLFAFEKKKCMPVTVYSKYLLVIKVTSLNISRKLFTKMEKSYERGILPVCVQ